MTRTKTQERSTMMDRPNGDLKAGDYVVVTRWCRAKSHIRVKEDPPPGMLSFGPNVEHCGEDEDGAKPYEGLFQNVLQVLGCDYPNVVVRILSAKAPIHHCTTTVLDCRDFECRKATPEYVAAFLPDPKLWYRRLFRR